MSSIAFRPAPLAAAALLLAGAAACDRDTSDEEPDRPGTVVTLPDPAFPLVTDSMLARGAGEDWPAPAGTLENHAFSPLAQIHTGNIAELVPVWIYSTGVEGALETSPIVVGNTLYATTAGGRVVALNAATGEELWTFDPEPAVVTLCCGPVNRGVSVWRDRVYVSSLDARLIALDARTGRPVWQAELADPEAGYSAVMAPLAIDGRVYVGVAGEQYGIRGFLAAYDALDGEELWRWNAIPDPDEEEDWTGTWEPTDPFGTPLGRQVADEREALGAWPEIWRIGGGGIATTPAYDRGTRRLFVNIEGPAPMLDGSIRPGDNLYTGSIVALDARTGELVWHAQYLPHDVWGLSGGSPPFLFDRDGQRYVAFAGRTGWVYVFRASDGRPVLRSDNFVPQENLFARPSREEGVRIAPGWNGGNSGSPVSHDPRTGTAFVGAAHQPMVYTAQPQSYARGRLWLGGTARFTPGDEPWGTVTAIDLATGEITWQRRTPAPVHSGTLATAGNLVVVGQGSGSLDVFDSRDGRLLWQFKTGAGVHGSPVTYSVAGIQFVVAAAGGSRHYGTPPGDDLIAFALASRRPQARVPDYAATDYSRTGPAVEGQGRVRQVPMDPPPPLPPEPDTPTAQPDTTGPLIETEPVGVDSPGTGR